MYITPFGGFGTLNPHYTYFLILAASLAGPLTLSFDKKVAFYKNWKYLFPAMIIPALLYIVWDIYFTSKGVWSFNEDYITGIKLINLPLEEVLFFFIVPYCCVFIYACVKSYFPNLANKKYAGLVLNIIAIGLIITGVIYSDRYYTGWTFRFTGIFVAIIYFFRNLYFDYF